jgi:hypothetical protein
MGCIAIILVLYCMFKVWNLSRKVHSVSDFVNGEIFSSKFHAILSNYFADEEHTKMLLEPITPWIRELVMQECTTTQLQTPPCLKPQTKNIDGMFFIDE